MSKTCPQCKTENRDQANFCLRCNARLAGETPVRYCPAGKHPMDPGWDTCPYCAASGQPAGPPPIPSRGRTLVEDEQPSAPAAPPPPPMPAAERAPAPPPPVGGAAVRRKTVFDSGASAQPSPGAEAGGLRRMVAVLVTYTWKPEGQLFPVREGRNYIGRDAECEICIPNDNQMSSRNSTILYRGEDFWISDADSMNGTKVNGENVEEKQRLPDGAIIRSGATVWYFVQLPKLES